MKKSIIAAGAASVALAAMPIVGAFAAVPSVTDNITATVGAGCTITNEQATNTVTIPSVALNAVSNYVSSNGISVTCNAQNWTISAVGDGAENHKTDLYNSAANASIPTGTTLDGTASNWAFKLGITTTEAEAATITSGYGSDATIPDTATVVATGTKASSATLTPSYKVSVGSSQAGGDYTGAVKYTVSASV